MKDVTDASTAVAETQDETKELPTPDPPATSHVVSLQEDDEADSASSDHGTGSCDDEKAHTTPRFAILNETRPRAVLKPNSKGKTWSTRANSDASCSRSRSRSRGRKGGKKGGGKKDGTKGGSGKPKPTSTERLSHSSGLDAHLTPRPPNSVAASSSLESREANVRAPNVGVNFMISQWILGKHCDVEEFADKISVCPMDLVCVLFSRSVTSADPIYIFIDYLVAATSSRDAKDFLNRSCGESMRFRDFGKVVDVLEEKAVLRLETSVWIVINRCKIRSATFIEASYKDAGGSSPAASFGHLQLILNVERQAIERINVGVLYVHRAVSKADKERITQWLVVKRIAVLCGVYPKGENTCSFVSDLARDAWAVGWRPCAQEVGVKTNRSGGVVAKTHPSFIMCFGFFNKFVWPESASPVPEDFEMGADILRELIRTDEIPWWDENYIGSTSVPKLGSIKQKSPNFAMWCRNSYQNAVWLGTSIPSKSSQAKAQERAAAERWWSEARPSQRRPKPPSEPPHPWMIEEANKSKGKGRKGPQEKANKNKGKGRKGPQ